MLVHVPRTNFFGKNHKTEMSTSLIPSASPKSSSLQSPHTASRAWCRFFNKSSSGCCKPPDDCSFAYVTPTNWTTESNSSFTDPDCGLWNNDPTVLCFNCESCKGGVLDNIKHDWKKVAIVNVIFLVFLVIVYSIGCCAFRNNREDNSWNKYPRQYP